MAIIDCCTREIVAWQLELRCRADEAIALIERAAAAHGIQPGELTLGSDDGSVFTARRFRAVLSGIGIRHRRGGYRDPESQAFIEKLARETQRTGGVAERIRDPRRCPPRDRRLRRALPPPPALRARLPDADRGTPNLGASTRATEARGLRCQLRRGAGHRVTRGWIRAVTRDSRGRSALDQVGYPSSYAPTSHAPPLGRARPWTSVDGQ